MTKDKLNSKKKVQSSQFQVKMKKVGPMKFKAILDKEKYPNLLFDEPAHTGGTDEGPDASRVLTSAILNCLSASLTFCLQKSRIPLDALESEATCTIARNEKGYWRIKQIDAKIIPRWNDWSGNMEKALKRCQDLFLNYCIVSTSVKEGIQINVDVQRTDS